jgi:hypothetical protein
VIVSPPAVEPTAVMKPGVSFSALYFEPDFSNRSFHATRADPSPGRTDFRALNAIGTRTPVWRPGRRICADD